MTLHPITAVATDAFTQRNGWAYGLLGLPLALAAWAGWPGCVRPHAAIQDRLQAPQAMEPLFLGSYFFSAALSIPLWLAAVKRIGLARAWLAGMLLAVAVFGWASQLGAGQMPAFAVVCALSGVALGADLALPGALLAGVIQANGQSGQAEGAYFGWWNFAIKLNLALAYCVLLSTALLAGCASPQVRDYAAERPQLDLRQYFNGTLDAYGLFTDRSGKVVKRFTVVMNGHWSGTPGAETGVLEEDFSYSDSTRERRIASEICG